MLKTRGILAAFVTAGTLAAAALHAQTPAPLGGAGNDIVTINAYGGGFSPATDLTTSNSRFRNSGTVGGTVTLWAHPNVGIRGNLLYARTDAGSGAPDALAGERPNVWAYSGDLVLRMPFAARNGRDTWFPYVVGGLGGKTYEFDTLDTETDFAGSFGAGLEYRFGPWGVHAEVRDIVTSFDRFGAEKTLHDVVWTAGIGWSF